MDKIEEILIQVSDLGNLLEIGISTKINRVIVNKNVYEILPSMIERFYSIIRTWEENYSGSILENSEMFRILLKEENKIHTIEGIGLYPKNYSEFKEWVGEVCVRDLL